MLPAWLWLCPYARAWSTLWGIGLCVLLFFFFFLLQCLQLDVLVYILLIYSDAFYCKHERKDLMKLISGLLWPLHSW